MRAAPLLVALACALVLSGEHSTVQGAAIIEDHSSSWGVGGSLARVWEGRKQQKREGRTDGPTKELTERGSECERERGKEREGGRGGGREGGREGGSE